MIPGGAGRFKLLTPDDYLEPADDIWENDTGCIRVLPFTIYPSIFELNRNESINLTIEFVPLRLGNHKKEFYMVCNNQQSRIFTVQGSSRQIDLSIVEINNKKYPSNINDDIIELKSNIYFSDVTVQTEKTQQIIICNDTGLPIEYEWVWVRDNLISKYDIQREALLSLR